MTHLLVKSADVARLNTSRRGGGGEEQINARQKEFAEIAFEIIWRLQ